MTHVHRMLQDMADAFSRKISEDLALRVQLEIQHGPGPWHVIVEPRCRVTVAPGSDPQSHVILAMTERTLRDLYTGEMTALTAAAKASVSDPAPLEYRLGPGQSLGSQLYADMLSFLQHFFTCAEPERIVLDESSARKVHGANAVALFYQPGFRSAWYQVQKGEQLNEPGDTNPFPQAFVFISGEGWARIGEKTLAVRAGEAYFVPPGSDHIVWTDEEEPVTLLWLAWGEGA